MIADMPGRLVSPITVGRGDELQVATQALTNILGKLGVASRTEAAAVAVRLDVIGTPSV